MGLFAGVKLSAVAVGGGKALDFKCEGDFVLQVTEVKGGSTRKKEPYFEVIHKVVESTNEEQPVGSTTNLFCMLGGAASDLGLKNMKEILSVMSGLNPYTAQGQEEINKISDEKWVEIAELACANQAVFGGTLVNCSVSTAQVKTPKPGGRTQYLARRYTPNAATVEKMSAASSKGKK